MVARDRRVLEDDVVARRGAHPQVVPRLDDRDAGRVGGHEERPAALPVGIVLGRRRPDDHPPQPVAAGGEDLAPADPEAVRGRDGAGRGDAATRRRAELGLDAQRVDERGPRQRLGEDARADGRIEAEGVVGQHLQVDEVHDPHERGGGVARGDGPHRGGGRAQVRARPAVGLGEAEAPDPGAPQRVDVLLGEAPLAVVEVRARRDLGRDVAGRAEDLILRLDGDGHGEGWYGDDREPDRAFDRGDGGRHGRGLRHPARAPARRLHVAPLLRAQHRRAGGRPPRRRARLPRARRVAVRARAATASRSTRATSARSSSTSSSTTRCSWAGRWGRSWPGSTSGSSPRTRGWPAS